MSTGSCLLKARSNEFKDKGGEFFERKEHNLNVLELIQVDSLHDKVGLFFRLHTALFFVLPKKPHIIVFLYQTMFHQILSVLCEEMGASFTVLLYQPEVR